jgi:hypothetical protein
MPDPRYERTARALADLVADRANMSPTEREALYHRLAAGPRGPVPPVDRSRTSPLGQQGSEFQPLAERDFLQRSWSQMTYTGPTEPISLEKAVAARIGHEAAHEKIDEAARFAEHSKIRLLLVARPGTVEKDHARQKQIAEQVQTQLRAEFKQISTREPFSVSVMFERERSSKGKRTYRRMDFPVYICGPNTAVDYLEDTLTQQGFPEKYHGRNLVEEITHNWGQKTETTA